MSEVARRAVNALKEIASRENIRLGVPLPAPAPRLAWGVYAQLLGELERALGGPLALEAAFERQHHRGEPALARDTAVPDPAVVGLLTGELLWPSTYAPVSSTVRIDGPAVSRRSGHTTSGATQLVQQMTIGSAHGACPPLFSVISAAWRAMAAQLGWPGATVACAHDGRQATLVVELPAGVWRAEGAHPFTAALGLLRSSLTRDRAALTALLGTGQLPGGEEGDASLGAGGGGRGQITARMEMAVSTWRLSTHERQVLELLATGRLTGSQIPIRTGRDPGTLEGDLAALAARAGAVGRNELLASFWGLGLTRLEVPSTPANGPDGAVPRATRPGHELRPLSRLLPPGVSAGLTPLIFEVERTWGELLAEIERLREQTAHLSPCLSPVSW